MNAIATPVNTGWSATLDLEFALRGARTALIRNRHQGPLRVQRPFYPEHSGQCHVYLLHPPGGIVAGDSLSIRAQVNPGAHCLLTTPSAGRVYKSNAQRLQQTQSVELSVAEDGVCEWLPQENIVFNSAQARNCTRIHLQSASTFIGWEITCLGRPASGDSFDQGEFVQQFDLYREGVPVLLERNRFQGGSELLFQPWGLNGATATGTLVCAMNPEQQLQKTEIQLLQDQCMVHKGVVLQAAATELPGIIVIRATSAQAAPIRNLFIEIWRTLRQALLKQSAVAPRIWFT